MRRLICLLCVLTLIAENLAAQDKKIRNGSLVSREATTTETANWLVPGDAALLAAAKAGYEGQKIHKPILVSSRFTLCRAEIATPIMIAGQLGAEQRKVFGPFPADGSVLEASGKLGVALYLQKNGREPDETFDAEVALQIGNEMLHPTTKRVVGRVFDYNMGLSNTTITIVSAFEFTNPPKGHATLLVRWTTGREDSIDIDFYKLNQMVVKDKL